MRTIPSLDPAWYCVRSQPKHEHIAAAHLRLHEQIEVFNPRLKVQDARARRQGWVPQPLFPGYLFARFALPQCFDTVRYTAGVKCLVHFGEKILPVPDEIIDDLRESMDFEEVVEMVPEFQPGEEVEILDGPFMGLKAVVQRHMPASLRVRVLLELLGSISSVDLDVSQVSGGKRYPDLLSILRHKASGLLQFEVFLRLHQYR